MTDFQMPKKSGYEEEHRNIHTAILRSVFCLQSGISCPHEVCTILKGTTNISLKVAGNFSSWTVHKYTQKQTNNVSPVCVCVYIYIYIYRASFTILSDWIPSKQQKHAQ
jgi:hypothetical protein